MARLRRIRVPDPLAPYADGFRSELATLGYTAGSIEFEVWIMSLVSRWLCAQEISAEYLNSERAQWFLDARRASGHKRIVSKKALAPLLGYLRSQGVVPPPEVMVSQTPADQLLDSYQRFLVEKRGLAPRSVPDYMSLARKFLKDALRRTEDPAELQAMTGPDITAFLLSETSRLTVGAANNTVNWLRSFLRFLHVERLVARDLAVAVPPVATWREARLPATLTHAEVAALLDSCDRSHPTGLRDFAMLIVLARLGLRASEVAGLELGDIDWRAGELVIRSKGRRLDPLPLPVDVGEALVAYLRDGRPRVQSRNVFITRHAPLRAIGRASVTNAVGRACERVGVPRVGAHRLRHALATEMLRRGATLPEIGQVLRHRDLATTAVYAKVDRLALASVVQPWPGDAR